MNTPDLELYAYYKERERLAREMYILDQKINKHLFMQYSLKKAEQEAAERREGYRSGHMNVGAVIPGIDPKTNNS